MTHAPKATFMDESRIHALLENVGAVDATRVREIIARAEELRGLDSRTSQPSWPSTIPP